MLRLDGVAGWACDARLPSHILRCDAQTLRTTLQRDGVVQCEWSNPLAALRWLGETAAAETADVRWIGYLAYELGQLFEPLGRYWDCTSGEALFCFGRVSPEGEAFPDESGT
ncbi:MAG: hypothetical protein JO353_12470, partial [Phycisphaerae bacterium]|nr:hypothetical protein [Phycisphaerae bacterium]